MKILTLAQCIAEAMHNDNTFEQKHYHYAFAFKRTRLIGIGKNNSRILSAKAYKFGCRFNLDKFKEYSYIHAEVDLIAKLWGRTHIDRDIKFVVIRLNNFGKLRNSKPCRHCMTLLTALNVRNIWWSTNKEEFEKL